MSGLPRGQCCSEFLRERSDRFTTARRHRSSLSLSLSQVSEILSLPPSLSLSPPPSVESWMFRMATLLGLRVWREGPRSGACLGERAKVSAIEGENAPCSSLRHPPPLKGFQYGATHAHKTRPWRNGSFGAQVVPFVCGPHLRRSGFKQYPGWHVSVGVTNSGKMWRETVSNCPHGSRWTLTLTQITRTILIFELMFKLNVL